MAVLEPTQAHAEVTQRSSTDHGDRAGCGHSAVRTQFANTPYSRERVNTRGSATGCRPVNRLRPPTVWTVDFRFVHSGTSDEMPPIGTTYFSFFDVDGDVPLDGRGNPFGSLYEFVSILGAVDRNIARTSTLLEGGVFHPSEALYAIASQAVNTPTDFHISPSDPSAASLPAIVAFELDATLSHFKLLLGGRCGL